MKEINLDLMRNTLTITVGKYTSYHLPEQLVKKVIEKIYQALPTDKVSVNYTDRPHKPENHWIVQVCTSNKEAISLLSQTGDTYLKIIEEIVEESINQVRLIMDIVSENKALLQ